MIGWLLLACAGSKGEDSGSSAEEAPYLVDEETLDLPEPTFDAAGAAEAGASAFAALRAITAAPIVEAYEEAMEGADSDCPDFFTSEDGISYWYDDCTSGDGTTFSGYGAIVTYTGVEDGGYAWAGDVVYGSGTITDEDGAVLAINGAAGLLDGESVDGVSAAWNVVDGDFSVDGADEGWLASGLSPSLQMQALSFGEIRAFIVTGTLAGLDGEIDAILADDMLIGTEETGTPCALEPTGGLSLRDAEGHWTDVLFDVPFDTSTETFGEMDPALCDGCGRAWFQGQDLGEVCFDFSVLLDWDGSPW